ncbi:uncharacterized protein LOC106872972 [Octopus bimaculoides]|uniref:Chitin-binding type-2 domain-containing protein n=1 Tax=Octopus bimaculoides TaxID=37653 RepID=A0A0L8H572_OCTBM|nr:uncharacterized protein LOC106872972 [Octopus bimaculoides]|eukprot:XP_014775644.1 PREDICTED: uncharacterized protein LOC106872972 [Octopus bimaculoides]
MEFRVAAVILLIAVSAVYSQDVMTLCRQTQIRAGSHFVRSPHNCSEFFACESRVPSLLACGKGSVFSQSQQVCVLPKSQYDDCGRQVYGGRFEDPLCNQRPFGLVPDPDDCNRFVPCFNRTSYPSMACQQGLHFNFNEQRCTSMDKANCRRQ